MVMILEFNALQFMLQLLSFLLSGGVVFAVSYVLLKKYLDSQKTLMLLDVKKHQADLITPVKLQAYERLTLFLDRISPDNLVIRHSRRGQTAHELRAILVQNISEEFNHNVSQQIFISSQSWEVIKRVKEQIIGIIDNCHNQCAEDASGPELGKLILETLMKEKHIPTQSAIEVLKKEIEIVL